MCGEAFHVGVDGDVTDLDRLRPSLFRDQQAEQAPIDFVLVLLELAQASQRAEFGVVIGACDCQVLVCGS